MIHSATDRDGELIEIDGRTAIRFRRRLGHPVDKVWRAVTEPEHLAAWFPTSIDGERAAGAPLVHRFLDHEADDMSGTMLRFEHEALIELRWGPDIIRIELTPADGGCVLTLVDIVDEKGKAARDGAGWHVSLDALEAELDGRSRGRQAEVDHWREVAPSYVQRFGPEASTIGPP